MAKKLYKYMAPEILPLSFARDGYVGFKCSLPKDYNDPFELSLCIDRNLPPQLLAYYLESIGEIPQLPTSCFSKSPVVVPMWAHYSKTSAGFVVEIDEQKLSEFFEDASINDVTYADSAHEDITSHLQRAFGTCKPRHTFFFHKAIMYYAYFSKQACWSYEQERRLVVPLEYIENVNGNMILFVPIQCVTTVIAGARAEPSSVEIAKDISSKIGNRFLQSFVGLSYPKKYMKDIDGTVYVFDGEEIIRSKSNCEMCAEPIEEQVQNAVDKKCAWCAINDSHRQSAAESNPYRALNYAGILEQHIQTMEELFKRSR